MNWNVHVIYCSLLQMSEQSVLAPL